MKPPLLIKHPGAVPLPDPLHWIVAGNGVFQVRRGRGYRAVTRVDAIPGLEPEQVRLEYDFPRLPAELLDPVLAFFSDVWRLHRGEAIALLFYDGSEQFRALVPPQRISGWERTDSGWVAMHGVRYEIPPRPEGFVRFGSIHSHGDLPAYASHIDEHDERDQGDGLHVVFGNVERQTPSRSAAFVAGGVRFPLLPEGVLEPMRCRGCATPAEWLAQITSCSEKRSSR